MNKKLTWSEVNSWLTDHYQMDVNLEAALFLIGVQELGKGAERFSKTQKLELIHIGICKVLSGAGYYRLNRIDEEGWPHYDSLQKIPHLKKNEQERFMKEKIVEYFTPIINGQ